MKKHKIVLDLDIPGPGTIVSMDKVMLMPAFLAILENAIDALDQAYSLILKIDSSEAAPEILQEKEDHKNAYFLHQRSCYNNSLVKYCLIHR